MTTARARRGTSCAEHRLGRLPKVKMKTFALYPTVIVVLSGCPDPDAGSSRLVGTWREVLTSIDTRQPDLLTVNDDGSYRKDTDQGAEIGTYDADATTVTIRSGEGTVVHELVEDYVVDG